jgi:hypothetical protein
MKKLLIISLLSLTSINLHAECAYAVHASCEAVDYDDSFKFMNFDFVGVRESNENDSCASLSSISSDNLARIFLESNYDISSICKVEVLDPEMLSAVGPTSLEDATNYVGRLHNECMNADNTESCYRINGAVGL